MEENLWEKVAVKCLEKAADVLDKFNSGISREGLTELPTAAKMLVDIALSIDAADREWNSSVDINPEKRMKLLGLKETASK